jgi:uncharacterized protein YndB with AHSA1/START domain
MTIVPRKNDSAPSLLVERWFDVSPVDLFAAYRDPKLLVRWFGAPLVARWLAFEHHLAAGAATIYGFITEEGEEIWGRCDYTMVNPPNLIAFVSSVTDPKGKIIRPLPGRDWMLRVSTSITIAPSRGGIVLQVAANSYEAGASEQMFFEYMKPSMRARYNASLDVLAAMLQDLAVH